MINDNSYQKFQKLISKERRTIEILIT